MGNYIVIRQAFIDDGQLYINQQSHLQLIL